MKRIDEKEVITDNGEVIRVYVLHPDADKMLAEEIAHDHFILYPSISVWANRFATFFNQAYTPIQRFIPAHLVSKMYTTNGLLKPARLPGYWIKRRKLHPKHSNRHSMKCLPITLMKPKSRTRIGRPSLLTSPINGMPITLTSNADKLNPMGLAHGVSWCVCLLFARGIDVCATRFKLHAAFKIAFEQFEGIIIAIA